MTIPAGYRVDQTDLASASDDEVRDAARLRQELVREQRPEDPPTPVEIIAQQLRANPPGSWRATFLARDNAGTLVGYAIAHRNLKDTNNAHIRWCDVAVKEEHRRRGLGRALFARMVTACEGQGDGVMFISVTSDRVPSGEFFARSIGARPGLPMKLNQLDLRTVDRRQVAEWARIDPPGYRLERIDDRVPDRLLITYIEAANGRHAARRHRVQRLEARRGADPPARDVLPAERTAVVARARDRRKDRRGRWVQRHRVRPAGSARDRAARYRGRRVAPWAPYRALDEGGDARADPRRAAAVTVHPDRKCECQRADARDQHEARLPPRLAGDPLADSADKSPRRRARTRRVSLTVVRCGPGGGLPAPCPYALSPLRPASLRIRSARSMPRSDFAIALPSAAGWSS